MGRLLKWHARTTAILTMQFDVYSNPIVRARTAFPLVASLQSDLADTGDDRVVAFLAPSDALRQFPGRLMPIVTVNAADYVLLVPSLTNLPARDLKQTIGNIARYREPIVAALDHFLRGV